MFKKLLVEVHGDYYKGLSKIYITLGIISEKLGKTNDALQYYDKAEKIFTVNGNPQAAKEIQERKEEILTKN